jgi:hypothetical protein
MVMSMLTAFSIWGSETSTMSSTSRRTIGSVIFPGAFTAMPSARVSPRIGKLSPLMALYIDGYSMASTPITCRSGFRLLAAIAIPEMSPPPPIGTTRVSISGAVPSISSATVPCPAMTSGSS